MREFVHHDIAQGAHVILRQLKIERDVSRPHVAAAPARLHRADAPVGGAFTDDHLTGGCFPFNRRSELTAAECIDCRTAHSCIRVHRCVEHNHPADRFGVCLPVHQRSIDNMTSAAPEMHNIPRRIERRGLFFTHGTQTCLNPRTPAPDEVLHIAHQCAARHAQFDAAAISTDTEVEVLDVLVADDGRNPRQCPLHLTQDAPVPLHFSCPVRIARIFCATLYMASSSS